MTPSPALLDYCRRQFPALARNIAGLNTIYFDGPAGTQVPQRVIEAMSHYLAHTNANRGGAFATSRESDRLLHLAHQCLADFLGASDPDCVVFGANMTSLAFSLARSLKTTWVAGDEIVVTRLDHDANYTPWVLAAREAGATVREVGIRPGDCTLDLDQLRSSLNSRTKLVAVGAASNATGGINPIEQIVAAAHAHGALVFVDAVHYAPHGLIDVNRWGCDFLACSAYKFFGPHVGVLWGRRELLEKLPVAKLRPAPQQLPGRWMTGTQSHEGIAGTMAAVEYLAELGCEAVASDGLSRREALTAAFDYIGRHERQLSIRLLERLQAIPDITIYGISSHDRLAERVSTFSFNHRKLPAPVLADRLGKHGVFVWHGNNYALNLSETLGLEPAGMVRVGAVHYNTLEEIDILFNALEESLAD